MKCNKCGKSIPKGQEHPETNHPEANPICYDCIPEDAKKRMSEKLTEKELLERLDDMREDSIQLWRNSHPMHSKEQIEKEIKIVEQAYTQLKEAVENYFIMWNSIEQGKKELAEGKLLSREDVFPQQKPTVSKKDYDAISEAVHEYELTGNVE